MGRAKVLLSAASSNAGFTSAARALLVSTSSLHYFKLLPID